ncbi:transketolase [Candidatus Gracilibacteria bacterium]|nr:transketolase [Candidatus Gracilibacteria bacterium]
MDFSFPQKNKPLGETRSKFLKAFTKNCYRTILDMLRTSQSGHPGGSLSCLDFLATLYAFRLSKSPEPIIISNGHISPGVYSVLAEMGAVSKEELTSTFRQLGSSFEGHVTRHIPGIYFGTGPLGAGISAAAGFAKAEKMKNSDKMVWGLMGDGEAQEGQVHEMALFAHKEKLSNFAVFCDYNKVQLTDTLEKTMPIDLKALFIAYGWNVIEIDGHNYEEIWESIGVSVASDKPTFILGNTIMGKGIPIMEVDGQAFKSTWHGKAPKPDQIDEQLAQLTLTKDAIETLEIFRKDRNFNPQENSFTETLTPMPEIKVGTPILYDTETLTDCRSAYGKALLDLAKNNKNILAGSADLGSSVMTKFVAAKFPEQYIEYGICEQNMVSVSGGLSFDGFVPFISTFGAFMSSRAKDQARVNDINQANVKMVSTHCGLSVGEDGPTHQAIDDMGSFLGMFNTMVIEPADPNHCDRIIRYVATHYGNCYVRMGRHKIPALTKSNGDLLFDANYKYYYGRTDILREGSDITIVASGPMVIEALQAVEESGSNAEILIASSPKQFDENLKESLEKTKKVIVVEDHNGLSGFSSQVSLYAADLGICLEDFHSVSVKKYELSGKPAELYENAKIGKNAILEILKNL